MTSAPPAGALREQRRRPHGARRRRELLQALEALLAERAAAEIEIADITQRAGVTRSLFYFYFSSKGDAVAALMHDVLAELIAAGSSWCDAGGSKHQRVTSGVGDTVALWRRHARPLVALLDAVPSDPSVRRQWTEWSDAFAARARLRIEQDQAAGRANLELDTRTVADVLSGMTLTAMERDVRSVALTGVPTPALTEALVHVWERSIYG